MNDLISSGFSFLICTREVMTSDSNDHWMRVKRARQSWVNMSDTPLGLSFLVSSLGN